MMLKLRLLIPTLLLAVFAFAQNSTQVLSGKVLNAKNEPIVGASINIIGEDKGTSTDVEGRYSLTLQKDQTYIIEVTAIGYASKSITDVAVGTDLGNELNIVLEIAAKDLEAVTVKSTSRRQENTAALLSFQKNNTAMSSGLAADFIRRTPDKNTGEILKRVSGASIQDNRYVIVRGLSDRYNAAMINNAQLPSTEPDKKVFSFDVFPAQLVDNIIINKTATPDLTGEFAGGLVQVNTKDVPAKDQLSVGFSFGFNTQSTFKDFLSNERNKWDWVGFDDGTRNIPAGFPSSRESYNPLSLDKRLEISRSFNNDVYKQRKSTAMPVQAYNLTWANNSTFANGARFGSVLAITYRKSQLKYNVDRAINDNSGLLESYQDDQNVYSVNTGALLNLTYVQGKSKISFKNLVNELFEDNYYLRTGYSLDRNQEVNFRSSYLNQRFLYSGQLEGEHQLSKTGIKLRWNGNASFNWKKQPDLRTTAYFRLLDSNDPFEVNDDDTRRFYSDLKDVSYGANGSLEFPFTLAEEKQTFKVGGSTLIRLRDFNSRVFRYVPASFNEFDASKNQLPYDQIYAAANISEDGYVVDEFTNPDDKYFGVSVVNGMFAMFDNKFGSKTRLVWGLRAENFQQFLTAKDKSTQRIVVNTEKWDFLPSFNLTFSPNSKQNIRVSGSRTLSRPEFREIAPFAFFDYQQTYGVIGNPALQRATILNGDIRYEVYPRANEAISFGVFYKYFNDPIELVIDGQSSPTRRQYFYRNADNAYTFGAELEVRKGLNFISEGLQDFSIFSNVTVSYSKVTLPGSVASSRPLQGQSPYLINAGIQYQHEGWNSSLLYNRIGQRLALVGDLKGIGIPDIYERSRNQLDFQLAKRILKEKGEVKLTWSDILNPAFYFYENVNDKKVFEKGTDRLFYSYTPGSTITIGFTYDFSL